ncbi:MAG: Abortive infection protein [Candidatus Ozemobacter sibiricus]|uniref:Abortive infection protein n=1 Tax=Candidatus Ozemobacter sibiricus TaxID=2268124 RepID=A0A367ZRU4_9BACT|nr:MAG: Abortive infection protein [Candidatus Ozemobacter sibiricus]
MDRPPVCEPIAPLAGLTTLCRMKTRLLWQSLQAWRSGWSLLVLALSAIGLAVVLGLGAVDFLTMVERLFLGEAIRWLLAFGLLYLVALVFTSDLIMGHTLNAGQLSTDHAFLATLPIPPLALLGVRIFERVVTDWPGLLFLWSGFVGVACRDGLRAEPFLVATFLFVQVQSLLVLTVILLSALLHRVARPATVNNFFSLFGYLSAFVALLPHVAISAHPREALTWLFFNFTRWQGIASIVLQPARWVIDVLLDGPRTFSFLAWQGCWLAGLALGGGLYLAMDRAHWFTWVHPGLAVRPTRSSSWLSGLLRKDFLLLRSDFNLLSNSLFMPVTIIVMQALIFRDHLTTVTLTHAMNMLAAAALYFCLFGPLNAVGSEGQAISLLETLPISPATFLGYKILFWCLVAESFFLPTALGIGWYLGLAPADRAQLVLWLAGLIPALVWVAVSLSAIFPRFEGKVLQQRSTFEGKILAPLAMGLALPVKDLSLGSLLGGAIYVLLAISLHAKATALLAARLDPERSLAPRFRAADAFLAILAVMGLQSFAWQVARTISADLAASLWPWYMAYGLSMVVLARTTWTYTKARFADPAAAIGLRACPPGNLAVGMVGGGLLAGLAAWYLENIEIFLHQVGRLAFEWFGLGSPAALGDPMPRLFADSAEAWSLTATLAGPTWAWIGAAVTLCLLAPLVEEAFFRGFTDQAIRNDLGWTGWPGLVASGCFFALHHPPLSMPLTFLVGVTTALLFRRTGSLWPGIVLHATYNAGILAIHAAHF